MSLLIGDNFNYQGQKPNFERDSFETLAAMKAYPETSIDDGHLSYCKENGKHYEYKSSNSIDPTTGKWREFKSGGGIEQVPVATDDAVGGFKTGYKSAGKNYAVQVDENEKGYVNVPWTDTNTTYNKATQQTDGLMSKEDKTKLDNLSGAYVQILTQTAYEGLEEKDNQTVYFIKG